jgi:hypothetical protein
VRFLEQDLFEADFRDATVVTLYLLPRLNLDLRPKLLRDLRPGTRVVSHDFDMAEWQPDQTVRLQGPSREHSVFYWVIPADVDGAWRLSLPTALAPRPYELRLEQHFQVVRGTMQIGNDLPISDATLQGDRLRFNATTREGAKMAFDGRVSANMMRGSVRVQGGPTAGRYNWTAQREAAGTGNAAPR